ncbi:MAG: helix-turn-helix domain-containing protein [Acidobacteria bacterium]|nr:helix-turn-helix domain-containing protein [Acidobacteriota bacterium]
MLGLYTTETLADYLQVSPHTVRREREAGRLPFVRIRDLVRYRPEDVESYLQHQSHDDYETGFSTPARVAAFR